MSIKIDEISISFSSTVNEIPVHSSAKLKVSGKHGELIKDIRLISSVVSIFSSPCLTE